MMQIVRVINTFKKNPCIFQNALQGYKVSAQQTVKMGVSSDALKEKLSKENFQEEGKEQESKEMNLLNEKKNLYSNENHFQINSDFAGNFQFKSKENILKLIINLSPSSAVLLMKNFCSNRARSLEILNALSEKLQTNPPKSLMECSTVLFCAAVLNFRDLNLISKMGQIIIENKSEFSSHKLPTNIMRSLGVLKYNEQELLEVLLGSILFYKPETPEDLVTSLTTLAVVNTETPYTNSLIKLLSNYQEVDYSHPEAYLNYVWSCVILNELNPSHISRVLSESFITKILDSDKQKTFLLKLRNIHGAASSLLKHYSGPLLKDNIFCIPTNSKSKAQFLESVKNSLYYICPKEGFLKLNVETEAGFVIDVECNVSSKGEIVRLKNRETSKRVGMILLDFHDFCLGTTKMTGVNAFKERIAQAKGYKTLLIPYTEFSFSARLSEKIDYLRKKLRNIE